MYCYVNLASASLSTPQDSGISDEGNSSSRSSTSSSECAAASCISEVFDSTDLIREFATYLIDDAPSLLHLAAVSKSCHSAILDAPRLWQGACQYRWRSKWGFVKRWTSAMAEARANNGEKHTGQWWRDRYLWQERDAKRQYITAAELHTLHFDFRFWLSQFWGEGNILASGLLVVSSQNLFFGPKRIGNSDNTAADAVAEVPDFTWPGTEWGSLNGHPSGRHDLQWFLDEDGKGLQWGKLPSLFPKGFVKRLDTWGWEIRNCNVCMRAMDVKVVVKRRRDGNLTNSDGALESERRLVYKNDDLWKDYLESMRKNATDFGMPDEGIAYLEAPPEFWEFRENRLRFPRLGIDGVEPPEDMT